MADVLMKSRRVRFPEAPADSLPFMPSPPVLLD
jgi:hypothetical protein